MTKQPPPLYPQSQQQPPPPPLPPTGGGQGAAGPREGSDLYSYNERSYNSWQYGDEASLYSIAEDSREDRGSEAPSSLWGGGIDTGSAASTSMDRAAVELRWRNEDSIAPVNKDDDERELPNSAMGVGPISEARGGMSPTDRGNGNNNSSGAVYRGFMAPSETRQEYMSERRRYFIGSLVIMTIVGGVLAAAFVSQRNVPTVRNSQGSSIDSAQTTNLPTVRIGTSPSLAPVTPVPSIQPTRKATEKPVITLPTPPTAAPSSMPSSSPSHSPAYILCENFVKQALSLCPGSSTMITDESSMQGVIFRNLVDEYFTEVKVTPSGFIQFPLNIGFNYLQEKYAMNMLYATTNGPTSWTIRTGWFTDTDPCQGWFGVSTCTKRNEGNCAVMNLDLSYNSLHGTIPQEMCCMPCLKGMNLAGNNLTGHIPTCLLDLSLDISGTNIAVTRSSP